MITQNQNWRAEFIADMGGCMLCGGKLFVRSADKLITNLSVHEMLRGKNRAKAYAKRELCLVLCDGVGKCCHPIVQDWPLAKQLALKKLCDPEWFSLEVIRAAKDNGRSPIIVTAEDVEMELIGVQAELIRAKP